MTTTVKTESTIPFLTPLSFFGTFGTSTNPINPQNHAQIDKIPFTQLQKKIHKVCEKFLEETNRKQYVTEEWQNQYAVLPPRESIVIGSQWGIKEENNTREIQKLRSDETTNTTNLSINQYVAYGDYVTLCVRLTSNVKGSQLQLHVEELLYFNLSPVEGLTQLIEKNFTPLTQINLDTSYKRIHLAKGIYETVYIFLKHFQSHGNINPHTIGIGGEYVKIRGFEYTKFHDEGTERDATILRHVHHSYKGPESFRHNPIFVSSGCNDLFALGLLILHVLIPNIPFYFNSINESFIFMHNYTTNACDCFYYLDEADKAVYRQLPLEPKKTQFGFPELEKHLSGLLQTEKRIIYSEI